MNAKLYTESAVEHCVPEGSSLCLPLPSNLNGLVVIWPRQPQSDEDCVCGLFVETSDVSFTDCYCLKLHLSVYDVHIFENHLCWNNLTREKNGTKYLIARDSFYSTPTRQFQNQGEIFIQGIYSCVYYNYFTYCTRSRSISTKYY